MPFPGQMLVEDLQICNPCFDPACIAVTKALYEGGKGFEALKDKLLYRRMNDVQMSYRQARLQCAEYFNRVGGIFDYLVQVALQRPPHFVFDGPPDKLVYYETLNTGLADLASGRFTEMELHGYGLIAVSFPTAAKQGEYKNLAQQKQASALDASLSAIQPEIVTDWQLDTDGKLLWLKTVTCEGARSIPYGKIDREKYTWTYITSEEKVVYEAEKDAVKPWPKDATATLKTGTPVNGTLPVFECSLPERRCVMDRLAHPAIAEFNIRASYFFALHGQCYGQPWYSGPHEKPSEICNKANEMALWMLGPGGSTGYSVPSGVAFDALNKAVDESGQNLLSIISAEFMSIADRDQHAASGAAKAQDKAPSESCAKTYADRIRNALCQAVDYIKAVRRDEDVTYTLQGMDDFSPLALQQKILNVTGFVALPAPKVAKERCLRDLAQTMATGATPAERQAIETEPIDLSAPMPGAQPGQPGATPAPSTTGASTGSTGASTSMSTTSAATSGNLPGDENLMIKPKRGSIPSDNHVAKHQLDQSYVDELAAKIKDEGFRTDLQVGKGGTENRVLVVDSNPPIVLDGHHRSAAAEQAGLTRTPAWKLDKEQLDTLLLARFDGGLPKNLSKLDRFIDMGGGKTYADYREPNSHSKGSGTGTSASTSAAISGSSAATSGTNSAATSAITTAASTAATSKRK